MVKSFPPDRISDEPVLALVVVLVVADDDVL